MKLFVILSLFQLAHCDKEKRAGRWKEAEETVSYWKDLGKEQLLKNLQKQPIVKRAKNVIVFMGDGMGIQTVTAGRILKGQKRGKNGESFVTSMESLDWTGLAKTYSVDVQTPDSASTANALFSGLKEFNFFSLILKVLKQPG
jgi:alkaline phosphatase